MRRAAVPSLLVLALTLAACAADAGAGQPSDPPASDPPTGEPRLVVVDGEPDGPGISVADALGHGPTDDIVVVTGSLFVDPDGTVRLCDSIAESFPPQCAGERILVTGLDLTTVENLQTEGQVGWAEAVTLVGSVE